MIRSEAEYSVALKRLNEQTAYLEAERRRLRSEKLPADQVRRLLEPVRVFKAQLEGQVEEFQRMKRGDFAGIRNLRGIGPLLIGLRIHRGMSQKELADQLGVHETQVSRDERNEYHNITLERAERILDVFGVDLVSVVEPREAANV